MKKTAFVLLVISCLVFGIVGTAYGFWEGRTIPWGATGPKATTLPADCGDCHGADANTPANCHSGERKGRS